MQVLVNHTNWTRLKTDSIRSRKITSSAIREDGLVDCNEDWERRNWESKGLVRWSQIARILRCSRRGDQSPPWLGCRTQWCSRKNTNLQWIRWNIVDQTQNIANIFSVTRIFKNVNHPFENLKTKNEMNGSRVDFSCTFLVSSVCFLYSYIWHHWQNFIASWYQQVSMIFWKTTT